MNRTLLTLFSTFALALAGCGVELELGIAELALFTGETYDITAVQPGNVTTSSDLVQPVWSSSDEAVATVAVPDPEEPRQAVITALGGGTATIAVVEGGEPASLALTVTAGAMLTIEVDAGAFQLVEARVNGTTIGAEGYSAAADDYASFVDVGDDESLMTAEGEVDFTFMTPTSWVLDGQRYQLTAPIVVVDRQDQTYTLMGDPDEYEEVP